MREAQRTCRGVLSNGRATSVIEYISVVVIVMLSIVFFQKYIVRGFAGRWKQVGDSFSVVQYDPDKTLRCGWSEEAQAWYDADCFEEWKNRHFQNYYDDCFRDCIRRKSTSQTQQWGACDPDPAAITCQSGTYKFWGVEYRLYDGGCCYDQCMRRCRLPAQSRTSSTCQDSRCE